MYQYPKVIERAWTKNGEIQLQQRGNDYEIIFNGTFLMATYNGISERLLVQWAIEEAVSPQSVLIAGLGVGFSLGEALNYKMIKKIKVVEIESKIIEWNRTYFSAYSKEALNQKKVDVENTDFIKWMMSSKDKYDVICLDIDNGPDWLVIDKNNKLYSDEGIDLLLKLLNKTGAVSFWSAAKSDMFEKWLEKWFNKVKIKEVPQERGEPDYIYLASKPKL